MSKKKNNDDRKVLMLRYRIDENGHVSFTDYHDGYIYFLHKMMKKLKLLQ